MKINQRIKNQRQAIGMSIEDMALMAKLSINQCIDVEEYEDEFVSTLKLIEATRLCDAIKLDIADVLELDNSHPPVAVRKSALVRDSRLKLGVSVSDLAEHIGFDESVVSEMEENDNYFDGWPAELVIEVAVFLNIPPLALIYPSKKAGS